MNLTNKQTPILMNIYQSIKLTLTRLSYIVAYQLWQVYLRYIANRTFGAQVIVLYQGKVLLVKSCYRSQYCFPGGYRNRGESPEENAIRELREETGLALSVSQISLVKTRQYYIGKCCSTDHIFVAKLADDGTALKPENHEIQEVGFYSFENALEMPVECFVADCIRAAINSNPKLKVATSSNSIQSES